MGIVYGELARAELRRQLTFPRVRHGYAWKGALLVAIAHGVVSRDEAKRVHGLSDRDLLAWQLAYVRGGAKALRIGARVRGRAA